MRESQPGFMVMVNQLFGYPQEMVEDYNKSLGKEIKKINFDGDELRLIFTDDRSLSIWDDGQSCCESRYLTCDDQLSDFEGGTFLEIDVADGAPIECDHKNREDDGYCYDCSEYHDTSFVKIKTSKGVFTVTTHVEHNGYYGGFSLKVKEGPHDQSRDKRSY